MTCTVKEVANVAGVSVRTLHHYHKIRLLVPSGATPAGYRLYSETDLERLQQILFFKELGFALAEIGSILDSPEYDRAEELRSHRRLLKTKRERLDELLGLVDRALESTTRSQSMGTDNMFEGFDETKLEEYKQEVREKYDPKIVAESERRTGSYSKEDWAAVKAEGNAINRRIAALMERGPADPETQEAIGCFYQHINDRFYTCTPEIFRGLGEMYVQEPRFTAFYEKFKSGMAEFMCEAMRIYSDSIA